MSDVRDQQVDVSIHCLVGIAFQIKQNTLDAETNGSGRTWIKIDYMLNIAVYRSHSLSRFVAIIMNLERSSTVSMEQLYVEICLVRLQADEFL
jgi:hypothetical protein